MFELKQQQNKPVEMLIVDPDVVKSGNIPRSNFCAAEIGSSKAQTLAKRMALAWGLECHYANELFDVEKHLKVATSDYRTMTVLLGCVDNHFARRDIHSAIDAHRQYSASDAPSLWWIDGGNGRSSGQVLLGSNTKRTKPAQHFTGTSICRSLPAPSLIHPDLLQAEKASRSDELSRLSCPDRVRLGEQSLNINQRVAIEMNEMLTQMFLNRSLKRFATYFDLDSGTCHSLYCTPDQITAAIRKEK
jgi:PRTRC genetic system ThiF family protein